MRATSVSELRRLRMAWIACLDTNGYEKTESRKAGRPRNLSRFTIELVAYGEQEGTHALHQEIDAGGLIYGFDQLPS